MPNWNKLVALIGVKDILKDNIEERVLNAYRINDLNNLLFLGDDFVGIEFKNLNQEEMKEIIILRHSKTLED